MTIACLLTATFVQSTDGRWTFTVEGNPSPSTFPTIGDAAEAFGKLVAGVDVAMRHEERKAASDAARARRNAEAPSWGRVHGHEVNGRSVACEHGTNCRKIR